MRAVWSLLVIAAVGSSFGASQINAQPLPPTVSPDLPVDVATPTSDIFPAFDDFSWRSFIALNWPAQVGADKRGKADLGRRFADATGPRVWTTWKSRFEIFQPDGKVPAAWTSFDGQNPCGPTHSNAVTTLSAFTAFGDFNQATMSLENLANPLVARNGTYVRYDVRVNEAEFNSIVANEWYLAAKLPDASNATTAPAFNTGSVEVKAAWKILTSADGPEARARYYTIDDAQVFDPASNACVAMDIALVGLHIVSKTPSLPQWVWSTFEHIDNVPGAEHPAPPAGVGLSFNDPSLPQSLDPRRRPLAITPDNPPVANPTPMQVVRLQSIQPSTVATNLAYWSSPEIKGSVWENYMLVMTQWPTNTSPAPDNPGEPFPAAGSALANTTMETYFQRDGFSCMDCHQIANEEGRDFVMFVSFDAFRPGVTAPADLFTERLAPESPALAGQDTMIENLNAFMQTVQE